MEWKLSGPKSGESKTVKIGNIVPKAIVEQNRGFKWDIASPYQKMLDIASRVRTAST